MPEKETIEQLVKMHKKAKRQPRKPVNLFAKKFTTCAKGNTARALRSRPSRSACQKLAVQV